MLGLIGVQISQEVIEGEKLALLVYAIPLNFYAIITMLVLFIVIVTNKDIGPMKEAELQAFEDEKEVVF
ncbi:sodium:proton antiporter, partial [Sulfurimonas sp. MAG313]